MYERDCRMDSQQQQQRINAAAQQFTDALVAASRTTSDRSVAAQKLGTQMTGYFFNSVMNNLRTQAEKLGRDGTLSSLRGAERLLANHLRST